MKTAIKIAQTLDILTDIFIKAVALYYIAKGQLFLAVICFGMSALWGMSMFKAKEMLKKGFI